MCFPYACHVLWVPSAHLQGVELVESCVTVLIVTSLVHVALREVHLRNHGIDRNLCIGVGFACLHHHVDDRARTCSTAKTGKDVDIESVAVARDMFTASVGIAQRVDITHSVGGKEQSACPSLLSCCLTQGADGLLHS